MPRTPSSPSCFQNSTEYPTGWSSISRTCSTVAYWAHNPAHLAKHVLFIGEIKVQHVCLSRSIGHRTDHGLSVGVTGTATDMEAVVHTRSPTESESSKPSPATSNCICFHSSHGAVEDHPVSRKDRVLHSEGDPAEAARRPVPSVTNRSNQAAWFGVFKKMSATPFRSVANL